LRLILFSFSTVYFFLFFQDNNFILTPYLVASLLKLTVDSANQVVPEAFSDLHPYVCGSSDMNWEWPDFPKCPSAKG
jgi:hypothetical protein